jgi:hypothetical protein
MGARVGWTAVLPDPGGKYAALTGVGRRVGGIFSLS